MRQIHNIYQGRQEKLETKSAYNVSRVYGLLVSTGYKGKAQDPKTLQRAGESLVKKAIKFP